MSVEENREKFIRALEKHKGDKNLTRFMEWLETTDFFEAPASTKNHSNFRGGLCIHSMHVATRMAKRLPGNSSAIFVGLMHDICKANFYAVSTRNVKDEETGKWEKQPFYKVEDLLPFGHGDKSVYLLMKYGVVLTDEEAMAIKHHMGAFGIAPGDYSLSAAFEKYPMALHLHLSDMEASYLDESRAV